MCQAIENYKGKARVEFITLLPHIEEAVKAGHTACFIYNKHKKNISCSVRQFQRLVREYKTKALLSSPQPRHVQPVRNHTRATPPPPPKKPQSFKHNPLPDQELIDSDATQGSRVMIATLLTTSALALITAGIAMPVTRRAMLGDIKQDWLAGELELDHIEQDIVHLKNGKMFKVIRITGTPYETKPEQQQVNLRDSRSVIVKAK